MDTRDIADLIALKFLGRPYIWGGDDPMQGFDCSGFVIEILKSVGLLPRQGDWTAHNLWERFKLSRVNDPHRGCLVFYGTPEKVTHVEYCLDSIHSIGASGGGSKTTSEAAAIQQNAYIKIRPVLSRSGIVGYVDPWF